MSLTRPCDWRGNWRCRAARCPADFCFEAARSKLACAGISGARALGSLACATLLAAAVSSPLTARADEWSGSLTAYGWVPWMDLEVTPDSGAGSVEADVSGGDVLKALRFTAMVAGDVHYGRVGLLQDFIYSSLGQDGNLSGPLAAEVDVDVEMLISTTAIGYKVIDQGELWIEPFAGVRYVSIETDVDIQGGGPIGASQSLGSDLDWWDPVIGVRAHTPLTEKVSAVGFFDIGGFGAGSDFTWEVFGGLTYALSDRFTADAGFRYISIDYDTGSADLDLDMYGPVIGLTARF